jgi:hypothetical protein
MAYSVLALWLASGAASHIYWVTRKYDYTTDYLMTTVIAAFSGPFAWAVGRSVYGKAPAYKPWVLIKKRGPHGR